MKYVADTLGVKIVTKSWDNEKNCLTILLITISFQKYLSMVCHVF